MTTTQPVYINMNIPLSSARSSRGQIRIRKVTISSSIQKKAPPVIQSASCSTKNSFQYSQTPRSAIGFSRLNNKEDLMPRIKAAEKYEEEDSVLLTLNELLTPSKKSEFKKSESSSKVTVSKPKLNTRLNVISKYK